MRFHWSAGVRRFYQRRLPPLSFLILAIWTICVWFFSIYPPVGVYMAIFTFVASVAAIWPPRLPLGKAGWLGVYCLLTLLEIRNLNTDRTKNDYPYVEVVQPPAGIDDWQLRVINGNPDHLPLLNVIIEIGELPLPEDSDEQAFKKLTSPPQSFALGTVLPGDWTLPQHLKPGLYQIWLITINNRFLQRLFIAPTRIALVDGRSVHVYLAPQQANS